MVTEYHAQVKKGVQFKRGVLYEGFLNGFSIYVETVKPKISCEYTFGCSRYYQDKKYSVVQLVYPTTTGVWPWQLSATEWFKANQPMFQATRRRERNHPIEETGKQLRRMMKWINAKEF